MSQIPKAKCSKCKHCKMITDYSVVVCDYLNGFGKILYASAYTQPKRCPNYEKLHKKNKGELI